MLQNSPFQDSNHLIQGLNTSKETTPSFSILQAQERCSVELFSPAYLGQFSIAFNEALEHGLKSSALCTRPLWWYEQSEDLLAGVPTAVDELLAEYVRENPPLEALSEQLIFSMQEAFRCFSDMLALQTLGDREDIEPFLASLNLSIATPNAPLPVDPVSHLPPQTTQVTHNHLHYGDSSKPFYFIDSTFSVVLCGPGTVYYDLPPVEQTFALNAYPFSVSRMNLSERTLKETLLAVIDFEEQFAPYKKTTSPGSGLLIPASLYHRAPSALFDILVPEAASVVTSLINSVSEESLQMGLAGMPPLQFLFQPFDKRVHFSLQLIFKVKKHSSIPQEKQ